MTLKSEILASAISTKLPVLMVALNSPFTEKTLPTISSPPTSSDNVRAGMLIVWLGTTEPVVLSTVKADMLC